MSLTGTLSTMALPDLLQWLSGASKTGTLGLTDGRFRKEILFRKGVIVSCSSDDPREYLGQFLLASKQISEDQLRQAMETQRATGVMLGKILLMVNALSEDDLRQALTAKAEESLFGLFLWKDGTFEFSESDPDLENLLPLSLKVEDILLEGLRRYDELQVILKAFSSPDFVLRRTGKAISDDLASRQDVQNLLQVVDGKRTLTEICLELRQSEFAVSRIAYALFRKGCLRVADEPSREDSVTPVLPAAQVLAEVERRVAARKLEEAIDLLERAVEGRGHDLSLTARLEEVQAAFVERARRHYLPPDHVVALAAPPEDLTAQDLTPQEMFLLSRINGAWTVDDIVTVSPLREVEALRVLKQLRERGLIDVLPADRDRARA